MQIGLTISKTFTSADGYSSITVSFWMIKEIKMNRILKTGYITLVPYTDRTYWTNNGDRSYYADGEIRFPVTPSNWPFVVGTDPSSKAWAFIKAQPSVDQDGNEINLGLDWSTAVDELL